MVTIRIFSIWWFLLIFFIKWQRWCKVSCLIKCNHEKKNFRFFLMERPYTIPSTVVFTCLKTNQYSYLCRTLYHVVLFQISFYNLLLWIVQLNYFSNVHIAYSQHQFFELQSSCLQSNITAFAFFLFDFTANATNWVSNCKSYWLKLISSSSVYFLIDSILSMTIGWKGNALIFFVLSQFELIKVETKIDVSSSSVLCVIVWF